MLLVLFTLLLRCALCARESFNLPSILDLPQAENVCQCYDTRTNWAPEYSNCGGDRYSGLPFSTRSPVFAQHGIAATSQPLVTEVALSILKQGGNAIDAAIAANAALGLMEPTGNGLGGDLFAAVWWSKEKKLYGFNGSGRSPMGLSYDELLRQVGPNATGLPPFGPLPITVPGVVDGWFQLHDKFGTMDMITLLQPAIDYATNGFPVSPYIAQAWSSNVATLQQPANQQMITTNGTYPSAFATFQQIYGPNNGSGPRVGQVFRNPWLANTLSKIAINGRDEFYKGSIAADIDAWAQNVGVYLRQQDFANHYGEWVDPLNTTYRGYTVFELPPNSQGLAALQQLNILEGFNLTEMGFNSADYLHVHIESKKIAFADRAQYYADPDFASIPIDQLLDKNYAAQRRQLINMSQAGQHYDAGNVNLRQGDTIFMTLADKLGNMISLIQSNYRGLGAGMAPYDKSGNPLGFAFQDRGQLFSLNASSPNVYAPAKRPFHTIIPAFLAKDGNPIMSFGVMGGDMQPQGHAQILTNLIDFGMNVQEAGDAARYYHTGDSDPSGYVMYDGGVVYLERGIGQNVRDDLVSRGHTLMEGGDGYGGYQAIYWDSTEGVYHGASESRKDGHAAGF